RAVAESADGARAERARGVEVGRPRRVPVHLRVEVVERTHLVSLGKQAVGEVRADEAGPARDQDTHRSLRLAVRTGALLGKGNPNDRKGRPGGRGNRGSSARTTLGYMRRSRRAVLRSALGVALVVVVFAEVVPRIASYGSVASQLATVSAPWAVALAAAAGLDVFTTALPWRALLPQLSWLGAIGFTQASTALTLVLPGGAPLGMAISFGLLRRLRVPRGPARFAGALTGIWSPGRILPYPLAGARPGVGRGD